MLAQNSLSLKLLEIFSNLCADTLRNTRLATTTSRSNTSSFKVQHIIFVAHNGEVFDIPFLIQQLSVNGMVDTFLQDKRIGFGIDTMTFAQKSIQANRAAGIPIAYNLGALYQYVTGQPPTVLHRSLADVKATMAVLFHQIFWENRSKFIFAFGRPEEEEADAVVPCACCTSATTSLLEDSDTSVGSQDAASTVVGQVF
jgi:hypothetical protein